MNNKRNLSKELNVKGYVEDTSNVLDISIDKIKYMVNNRIASISKEMKQNK